MRARKLQGFILKRTNYGEADKIITLFTSKEGKVKVLAKGVRRIKSRRAPHLELFNQVEIMLHRGKTFDIITEAKVLNDYHELKHELKLSGYHFYVSEIIDKLLPENQPHPNVFALLQTHLATLESHSFANSTKNERLTKEFVVQLLWDLGYLPKGQYPKVGVTAFVESIIEKSIKSKKFLEEI